MFATGCGVFDPGPQILEEGSSGDVTGTVEYIEVGGPSMQPRIISGAVSGRHSGADVSLGFRYEDGRRGSFTGEHARWALAVRAARARSGSWCTRSLFAS